MVAIYQLYTSLDWFLADWLYLELGCTTSVFCTAMPSKLIGLALRLCYTLDLVKIYIVTMINDIFVFMANL